MKIFNYILVVMIIILTGCGSNSTKTPVVLPTLNIPAQPVTNVPVKYFTVVTTSFVGVGNPFSISDQIPDKLYPIQTAYKNESTKVIPDLSDIKTEVEQAISKCWFVADPRVAILSGVSANPTMTIRFVDSITYGNTTGILGLTSVGGTVDAPTYDVQIALKDPVTNPQDPRFGQLMQAWELRRVLIHEIGHVLGLGHAPDVKDVMYWQSNSNQGKTFETYLTFGDALSIWGTLTNKSINWVAARPAVTQANLNMQSSQSITGRNNVSSYSETLDIYTRQSTGIDKN